MSRESLVFAICGAFFGVIVGWMLGSLQLQPSRPSDAATQASTAQAAASSEGQPPPLDVERVTTLKSIAERDPSDLSARVSLGNLHFDAERYEDAAHWYEEAFKLDPRNPNVSTDLGVSYYYLNQPDRALRQFERSLEIDPRHTKTMLNVGIVRAFGKQDLAGAVKAWHQVLSIAPDSPEGRAAKEALARLQAAHPELSGGPPGS